MHTHSDAPATDLNPMKYKAYHHHVIAKKGKKLEVSNGGIILPESAKTIVPIWYTVVDVGRYVDDLEPGDMIMFKDTAQVSGQGEIVMRHTAVMFDVKSELASIYKEQIIVVRKKGTFAPETAQPPQGTQAAQA